MCFDLFFLFFAKVNIWLTCRVINVALWSSSKVDRRLFVRHPKEGTPRKGWWRYLSKDRKNNNPIENSVQSSHPWEVDSWVANIPPSQSTVRILTDSIHQLVVVRTRANRWSCLVITIIPYLNLPFLASIVILLVSIIAFLSKDSNAIPIDVLTNWSRSRIASEPLSCAHPT